GPKRYVLNCRHVGIVRVPFMRQMRFILLTACLVAIALVLVLPEVELLEAAGNEVWAVSVLRSSLIPRTGTPLLGVALSRSHTHFRPAENRSSSHMNLEPASTSPKAVSVLRC